MILAWASPFNMMLSWLPVVHACIPGSNPADHVWSFQRNILVSPLSMVLHNHVNGGLVELNLIPVYRR